MSQAVNGNIPGNSCWILALDLFLCVAGAQCEWLHLCAGVFAALHGCLILKACRHSCLAESHSYHVASSPLAQFLRSPSSFFHL